MAEIDPGRQKGGLRFHLNWQQCMIGSLALLLLTAAIVRLRSPAPTLGLLDNLASPYEWCTAGESYEEHGDAAKASHAFERAVALGPHEAGVMVCAAEFELTRDDPTRALPYFSRALRLAPDYDALIFGRYQDMDFAVADVLAHGIPGDRRAGQAYFDWLIAHEADPDDATLAWQWLARHAFIDARLAGVYAGYLLRWDRYDAAVSAWTGFAGPYPPGDRVFNGGFEKAPMRSPLDWNIDSPQAERDSGQAQTGRASLRIRFTGSENIDFHHVWEDVVVASGAHRFAAFVKTEGITTNQGIGFHIFDPEQPARLDIRTDQFTGTRDWTRIDQPLMVPHGTRLLTIQICRSPSQKIDNKIAGTAWVDSISLMPGGR